MMQSKGMSLVIKPLFILFLIIFVFLMLLLQGRKNITSLKTDDQFSTYKRTNAFMLALLSNPNCVSVGTNTPNSSEETLQGVLDAEKLDALTMANHDIWCVENLDFMYSLEVKDLDLNQSWLLGYNDTKPEWATRNLKIHLPAVIKYNDSRINTGAAALFAYFGAIPTLYSTIKEVCLTHRDKKLSLDLGVAVDYQNKENRLMLGEHVYVPYFSCRVASFGVPSGKHLILLHYTNQTVSVIT